MHSFKQLNYDLNKIVRTIKIVLKEDSSYKNKYR